MVRHNQIRRKDTAGISVIEVVIIAVLLFVVVAILFPLFVRPQRFHTRSSCITNLKTLGVSTSIYSSDFDEKLPLRDTWMDGVAVFAKGYESRFHCPGVVDRMTPTSNLYGYAFHSQLSNVDQSKIKEPENVPMIYDSVNLARNASDPFSSLPIPPRKHRNSKGNVVLYADTRAKVLPIKDVKK